MASTSATTAVRIDPRFLQEAKRSQKMAAMIETAVTAAADNARELVPTRLGHLKESIKGEVFLHPTRGVVGKVTAYDFKAWWHEMGTVKMKATPFLRSGGESAVPGADWDR